MHNYGFGINDNTDDEGLTLGFSFPCAQKSFRSHDESFEEIRRHLPASAGHGPDCGGELDAAHPEGVDRARGGLW